MRSRKVIIGLFSTALIVAALPSVALGQQGFDEISGGEYVGTATAAGSAEYDDGDLTARLGGAFTTSLEFIVPIPSGPTTGTWQLAGSTAGSVSTDEGSGSLVETHTAEGALQGDRETLELGIATITSRGTFTVPPNSFPSGPASAPVGPLELEFEGILCDLVWGEWILTWEASLQDYGYSPAFDGEWSARRLPISETRQNELMASLTELIDDLNTLAGAANTFVDGAAVLPVDTVWPLVEDAIELINELNNLSRCDAGLLGEARIQLYVSELSQIVRRLMDIIIANAGDDAFEAWFIGVTTPGETMFDLMTIMSSTGAGGEGSLFDTAADQLETRLSNMWDNGVSIVDGSHPAYDVGRSVYESVFGGDSE